jgi:hypothetical protein
MDPESDHWDIRRPPTCLYCGSSTRRIRAKPSNPNGDADRPYYYCKKCDDFSCFVDILARKNLKQDANSLEHS